MSVRLGDIIGQIGSGTYKLVNAKDIDIVNATDGTSDGTMDGTDLLICDTAADGTVKKILISQLDHDTLTNFAANEHIDWTSASQNLYTTGYVQASYCRGDGANGVALYARSGNALRLGNSGNTYYTELKSAATANVTYTLPPVDGDNGEALTTNGSGTLSWAAVSNVAGNDTEIQFNDGGVLAGDSGFTFNKTTDVLTLGGGLCLSNQGQLTLYEQSGNGTNYVGHTAVDAITTNVVYRWPDDGDSGDVLQTDGNGVLSWIANANTPAGSKYQIQYNADGVLGASANFTYDYESSPNVFILSGALKLASQNELRFGESGGSNYVGFEAPASIDANKIWVLPAADGTEGQCLSTNGSGTLSWTTPSGASAVSDLTDVDLTDIANGKILKYNSGTSKWECEDDEEGVGGSGVDTATRVNICRNAFQLAINGGLSVQYLMDGIVDEFEDETGVDTGTSTNETYDGTNNRYSPAGGVDSYTKLLLHCDGADASTTITDSSASEHSMTCVGNSQLDTDQKVFGTASLMGDGTGDRVWAADSADWDFGSGDFTIDFRVRWNTATANVLFLSQRYNPGASYAWQLYWTTNNLLYFQYTQNGSTEQGSSFAWAPSANTWYHVAVVRNDANLMAFVNGTQIGSTYDISTHTIFNSTAYLDIAGGFAGYVLNGWMDEIRVSKGIARWTTTFTPPTGEYSADYTDITLQSNAFTAEAQPSEATLVIFEEDDDAITENTDLKGHVSRDGGSTFTEVTLVDEGDYASGKRLLIADNIDISGQPAGTSMKWKIASYNTKNMYIHGVGLTWRT